MLQCWCWTENICQVKEIQGASKAHLTLWIFLVGFYYCLLQLGSDFHSVFLWTPGIIFLVFHPFYSAGEEMRQVSVLSFNSFASFL